MMIAAIAMLLQASAISPPTDWQSLPPLPLHERREQPPQLADFVQEEIRAGRCALPAARTTLDLVVMVAASGQVRRIVPRAIGCPTVEQFAAGIVIRSARDNITPPPADAWFRATVALVRP